MITMKFKLPSFKKRKANNQLSFTYNPNAKNNKNDKFVNEVRANQTEALDRNESTVGLLRPSEMQMDVKGA